MPSFFITGVGTGVGKTLVPTILCHQLTRSGRRVAALFHSALALNFLVAWLSLGAQVSVLIGSRGLLPIKDHLELLRSRTQLASHLGARDEG